MYDILPPVALVRGCARKRAMGSQYGGQTYAASPLSLASLGADEASAPTRAITSLAFPSTDVQRAA
jgi:hypothetical protein